jgi:hypothetical protein
MNISHLERRRIEAGVLVPLIQAFQRAFGRDAANAVAREAIVELARKDGERWAAQLGDDLDAVRALTELWSASGALEIENLAASGERVEFNVKRCRYAEYFQEMGLPELGYLIHCSRDFAMLGGFNPALRLKRTQTLMQGAACCDFRFSAVTANSTPPEG